jgi:phosphoglycolate phosphatase
MKSLAKRPCRLFLFDLDGTLIDSRADITGSVNRTLARMNLPQLHESRITDFVGNGMQVLVERTLREATGASPESSMTQEGIRLFQEEYSNHLLDRTYLYPHVKEGLDRLSWARFAVVSNKPEMFSRRILDGLGIGSRFFIVLGGDSTPKHKPDPASLLMAMKYCRVPAMLTAMVGDSPVDMQAGKAAGVTTCGVLGGYRPAKELEIAGCDLIIDSLLELADHFCPPES